MTIRKACSTCASPCHEECTIVSGVHVVVTPTFQPKAQPAFKHGETDLLVLSMLQGLLSHSFEWAVSPKASNVLLAEVEKHGFTGELGSYLVVDLHKHGVDDEGLRFVLIAGIGYSEQFSGRVICEVFGTAIDQALELGVRKLSIPIAPHRLTAQSVNLKGTAATLRCRIARSAEHRGGLGRLSELEVFLSRQAKRHFDLGLQISGQLCRVCQSRRLDTIRHEV